MVPIRARRAPLLLLWAALAAAALLSPGDAGAQRVINPCGFGANDGPCKVEGGEYRALIPRGPGPHPVVVYLYGSLGLSERITASAVFQRQVVRRGYALLVPSALEVDYVGNRRGTGWGRLGRARGHPRNDIAFLARVLLDAQRRLRVDPDKVIFAGQSDGGFFIWEIACHVPQMGSAFAVHAASYGGPLPERCKRPVRFLHTHGRQDKVVPFRGPMRQGGRIMAPDIQEALDMLGRSNGCGGGPRAVGRYDGFDRVSWQGCPEGIALDFLAHDGGHNWPPRWLGTVLDWFEETGFRPARAVRRRVGDRDAETGQGPGRGSAAGTRFRSVAVPERGGRFKPVPE